MSEEFKATVDDMIEKITETLEKAKQVAELHAKIDKLVEGQDFSIKMSVASMLFSRAILEEADDFNEAYSYVARISHALVDVIDRHKQLQEQEDDDDDEESTLQ